MRTEFASDGNDVQRHVCVEAQLNGPLIAVCWSEEGIRSLKRCGDVLLDVVSLVHAVVLAVRQ